MTETTIEIQNLSKRYRLYDRPSDRLKEVLTGGRKTYHREFWALKDLSLRVSPGTTIGVMGHNGSGKSTLLQLLAGVLQPTKGLIQIKGRVAALLELGAGFNPEFTGRENVFLSGAIQGINRAAMAQKFDEIVAFAGLGEFIDQPVKVYSSGMYVRLAFAVATSVDPDVLLVDEALAVGDASFQQRCMRRIHEFKRQGKTIFFVSHDAGAVVSLCDEALLLDHGQLLYRGKPDAVVQRYAAIVYQRDHGSEATGSASDAPSIPNIDHRFGNGMATILGISLLNHRGEPCVMVGQEETVTVRLQMRFNAAVEDPLVGLTLRDRLGVDISATNTMLEGQPLPSAEPGQVLEVDFTMKLPCLQGGNYSLSPAVALGSLEGHVMCDWIDNALTFEVEGTNRVYGIFRIPTQVVYREVSEPADAGQVVGS